jgi:hypothetical protein
VLAAEQSKTSHPRCPLDEMDDEEIFKEMAREEALKANLGD